jgi:hypothetical protein
MKRIRAVVAAGTLVAGIVAGGIAFAQAPPSPSAATRAGRGGPGIVPTIRGNAG